MHDFATGSFLISVAACAAVVAALVLVTWLIGRAIGRYNVIDVAWGLGFVLVAWVAFALSAGDGDDTRRVLVAVLVTLWGCRLAGYIGWRSRGRGEDPRYTEMLRDHRAPASRALGIFLTQAAAIWFVSLPVQVAMFEPRAPGALLYVGTAVWVVGFTFESVGDWQLQRFRADEENRGQVMDHGLWRYTRHPNYFGDACVWWGLYLIAAQQWVGAVTILSPVVMTWTLTRKTGKPLLERDIAQRRPGYARYVERTSGFLPLPPKRGV
jgi:steroid 5-alpha reductase family enzyme